MKSKRPLSFWTLLNGYFTLFNAIEDVGIFSLFSEVAFLKKGTIIIFHSVFVGLGCFSLGEKHTHRGILHPPTNHQDTKSKVLARSGQQPPASPAVTPPGLCPIHLPAIWSLPKYSPGMLDTTSAILLFSTFSPPDTPQSNSCSMFHILWNGELRPSEEGQRVERLALLARSCCEHTFPWHLREPDVLKSLWLFQPLNIHLDNCPSLGMSLVCQIP